MQSLSELKSDIIWQWFTGRQMSKGSLYTCLYVCICLKPKHKIRQCLGCPFYGFFFFFFFGLQNSTKWPPIAHNGPLPVRHFCFSRKNLPPRPYCVGFLKPHSFLKTIFKNKKKRFLKTTFFTYPKHNLSTGIISVQKCK